MNYRLKGHESFILREGWITKALFAIKQENGSKLFYSNYGADNLGVGSNMAKSIRYWMRAAGLTKEIGTKEIVLSDLGEVIFKYDPYIEDVFTLYVIHANIACNFEQATSWNVFFNDFDLNSFSRLELFEKMTDLLIERTGESKLPERSIKDDCSAILAMYYSDRDDNSDPEEKRNSPFAQLGLLVKDGNYYEKCSPAYESIDPLIVLYLIADNLSNNRSVLIDDLMYENNMPGKLLNLNRIEINDCLDKLAEKGYIIVNRTAGLDIVYLNKEEINDIEIVKAHFMEG